MASLNGCIKEDRSDCPGNCLLNFSYVGDGTTQIFQDKIHNVDMYVFDSNGTLLSSHPVSEADVSRKATQLILPVGDYRIVTLGNTLHTTVTGKERFVTALFHAQVYGTEERVTGNDSLYYACREITIPGDAQDIEKQMDFASSYYKVHVEVAGITPRVSDTDAAAWPVITLSGVLPTTDFYNEAGGTPATYYPATVTYEQQHFMLARFNILRHPDSKDIVLRLTAADGEEMAAINLADFLQANPFIDLSKHEALIPIRIEFKEIETTVTVPQWYITQVKPEF